MNETQHKTSQPQHQLSSSQYEKCLARSVKPDNEEMNLTKSLAQARRFMQLFFIRTIKSSCQEIQLRLLVLTISDGVGLWLQIIKNGLTE